ncbi:uroporphyrinogen decarboxylase family protein [Christensenellaceae bacterium OttesenSCG-928-K19]|nr:uroporphyrinogen decarboxylase family protein [Christensenellaceae bacterium OttesenSCG-928-K19]
MKRNMDKWFEETLKEEKKQSIPVLSFPAIQLMDITVKDLIASSDAQANGMATIAQRVPTGASVSLMDLSVEAECFGSEILVYDDEVPAVIGSIVSTQEEADALKVPEVGAGRTGIYVEAMEKAMELITDRPVFAGIIGPYSLAGRLLDVTEAMIYCYDEPEMVHTVLRKVTDFLIEYTMAYKKAGANGVVMAEPLTGLLSPDLAEEFSCTYVKEIIDAVEDENFLVVYHNCGGGTIAMIDNLLNTGARMFHFGDAIDMEEMMKHIPADRIAMGNISPSAQFRNGTPESMREAVLAQMEKCTKYPNFVISSGCDVPPLSPWENIDAFFAAVDEFYKSNKVGKAS